MGALEQIIQLRNQGTSDEDIIKTLQNGGFSPKEINDSFNQAQIKNAVSDEVPENPANIPPSPEMEPQNFQTIPEEQDVYYPQPQQGQEDYYSPGESDTSTIIEISEQVFSEKIQTLQKKIEEVAEFKVLAESKMSNLLERIKNVEKIINNLQISILKKVGSYGGNLENIKNEMSMMQDSFRKMVNPIAKHAGIKPHHKKIIKKPVKTKAKRILRKKR
jgi:DNA-binding transcriptional MerR regulator